jgi:hypothetical protein
VNKRPEDALERAEETVEVMQARDARPVVRAGRYVRLWLDRWGDQLERVTILLLVLSTFGGFLAVRDVQNDQSRASRDRVTASAKSQITNCKQVEALKSQVRQVVTKQKSRTKGLHIPGFGPKEKRQAIRDADDTLRRFHKIDCYSLPIVKTAGLRR